MPRGRKHPSLAAPRAADADGQRVPAGGRMRILRVTEQAVLGGEQTDVLHLLAQLDPARYEQTLCTEAAGPLVDEAARLGIPHIPMCMRSRFDLAAIRRLRDIVGAGRYDIVHLHGSRAGLLGRVAARLARARIVIWTMHVFQADVLEGWGRWQAPLYLLVEALLARWFCDHIITVSHDLRERALRLESVPAHKVTTIYSHVALDCFGLAHNRAAKRMELGLSPDALVVCTVGRLCAQKGLPDFLQAAARVYAQLPEVRFLVVGDGPLRSGMEELAAKLGLTGCLEFTGYRSDVAEMMAACDVFATATRWEGMGKVLVEAMAAGRPLVSTDVGPIPEIVRGYRGAILTPPRDPQAFAGALLTVLQHLPAYARWADEDRAVARARFGGQAMAQRTSALYEQLAAGRLPAARVAGLRRPGDAGGRGGEGSASQQAP